VVNPIERSITATIEQTIDDPDSAELERSRQQETPSRADSHIRRTQPLQESKFEGSRQLQSATSSKDDSGAPANRIRKRHVGTRARVGALKKCKHILHNPHTRFAIKTDTVERLSKAGGSKVARSDNQEMKRRQRKATQVGNICCNRDWTRRDRPDGQRRTGVCPEWELLKVRKWD
jgi:hypothetical protein